MATTSTSKSPSKFSHELTANTNLNQCASKQNRGTPPKSMRKTSACLGTGITAPTMPQPRRRRNCPVPQKTATRQLWHRRERRRTAESPESLWIDLGIEQGGKGEKMQGGVVRDEASITFNPHGFRRSCSAPASTTDGREHRRLFRLRRRLLLSPYPPMVSSASGLCQ